MLIIYFFTIFKKNYNMENFNQSGNANLSNSNLPPKNWLIESILVTVLCCLPLGIIGIINASSVEGKYAKGDIDGANKAAQLAKTMVLISAISGVVGIIIWIFFGGMALLGGVLNGGNY